MAEAVLMGAGIGAGTSILTGRDPIKGMMVGGALGGAGSAMAGGAGATAGAGTTSSAVAQGPAHFGEVATQTIGANTTPTLLNSPVPDVTAGSGLLDTLGSGMDKVNEFTGMENKDWTMLALNNMDKLTPEQQQAIQHANLPAVQGAQIQPVGQVSSGGPLAQTQGLGPQEQIEQRYMYQNPAWGRRIGG